MAPTTKSDRRECWDCGHSLFHLSTDDGQLVATCEACGGSMPAGNLYTASDTTGREQYAVSMEGQ